MKEAATSSHIRRESPYYDCELWRNNVGVAHRTLHEVNADENNTANTQRELKNE